MTKNSYHIAILGATGVVGQKMIYFLEKSTIPIHKLTLLSSKRSAGKKFVFRGEEITVTEATETSFEGVDIALFSAGGAISKKFAPIAVQSGAVVIDNTSAYRMEEGIPLVVPEVNSDVIPTHKGIIANPNCSTIQMVVALKPIADKYGLERVVVSTYQAVSGAGSNAITELNNEIISYTLKTEYTPKVLPVSSLDKHYPIFPNVIPQIDKFVDNGFTFEEMKMMNETKKILNDYQLKVSATCVRIPIVVGHSESVYIETKQHITSVEELKELLSSAPGITLLDNVEEQVYPMPYYCVDSPQVFVGRIRKDPDVPNGFHLWIVADNLAKGAAANSVQIAEQVIEMEAFTAK